MATHSLPASWDHTLNIIFQRKTRLLNASTRCPQRRQFLLSLQNIVTIVLPLLHLGVTWGSVAKSAPLRHSIIGTSRCTNMARRKMRILRPWKSFERFVKLSCRLVVVEVCMIHNNMRLVRSAVLGTQLPIGIKQEASTSNSQ